MCISQARGLAGAALQLTNGFRLSVSLAKSWMAGSKPDRDSGKESPLQRRHRARLPDGQIDLMPECPILRGKLSRGLPEVA
jgi:hypothetical protein